MALSTQVNSKLMYFAYLLLFIRAVTNDCINGTENTYDFVIVGGGTAGCVLAARLSEVEEFSVVLLEAGGEPPLISKIPSLSPLMYESEVDWNYTSTPQLYALYGSPYQAMNMTQARVLGGCGSINDMSFFRGSKIDYNNWEKGGAKGWEGNSILNYFIKSENDTKGGSMCITNPGRDDELINSFLRSVEKLGYNKKDPNEDWTQTGFSYGPINVCRNQRQSTYTNYLKPVLSRKNLKIETFAFVEKILFDKSKRAIGVIYKRNGCQKIVNVTKEVILSAGAINSPQILMLSGIGPRYQLELFNVSVLLELPVGDNFLDHLKMDISFTRPYEDIYNNETLKQFFDGRGPLTKFAHGSAFITSRYSRNIDYPDIHLLLHSHSSPVKPGEKLVFSLSVSLLRPKSRGILYLNSKDPYIYPLIDPRYLIEIHDLRILAEGTRIAVSILDSMNISQYGYRKSDISVASCDRFDKGSDHYWNCLVRYNVRTLFDYSGTCRMGESNDNSSVVDNNLRLIGVKNVRVVDASVIPYLPSAGIQPTVIMIAEKGADIIKTDYL